MTRPPAVVERLARALEHRPRGLLAFRVILTEDDAVELLRLARLADPWHVCTDDGPQPVPVPERRALDVPDDPPF